jgi:TolA-binding protein
MPNGFKVSTWTEVLALLSIVLMAVAGLAWGLKLDGSSTSHDQGIAEIRARQDDVRERLTTTEERLRAMDERVEALERRAERD